MPIIILVIILVYMFLPCPIQLIFSIINFFIPDPIPYLDEIIMWGGLLSKIIKKLEDY